MRVSRITVANFRGIHSATIFLPNHAVLIANNNTVNTTILEALDLALGPDRLNRMPPVDEHDFYQGKYVATAAGPPTDEGIQAPVGREVAGAAEMEIRTD